MIDTCDVCKRHIQFPPYFVSVLPDIYHLCLSCYDALLYLRRADYFCKMCEIYIDKNKHSFHSVTLENDVTLEKETVLFCEPCYQFFHVQK